MKVSLFSIFSGFLFCVFATGATNPAVDASNKFGFDLYLKSRGVEPKNSLISPVSAYFALAMASNGAVGRTAEEIRAGLQSQGMNRQQLNENAKSLLTQLNAKEKDKDWQLAIANSLWIPDRFTLKEKTRKNLSDYYRAKISNFDPEISESASLINGWAAKNTNGKITNVVGRIEEVVYLLNATYFKADWTNRFNKDFTSPAEFLTNDKTSAMVPTMLDTQWGRYGKVKNAEVIELSYGAHSSARFMVLLPTNHLREVEDALNHDSWKEALASLKKTKMTLSLPKFKHETETILSDSLIAMGMKTAFSGAADFSNLLENSAGFGIQAARQKAYIALDENGTEAAAVTKIAVGSNVETDPITVVNINRPFIYAIVDAKSEAILFLGSVNDPKFE